MRYVFWIVIGLLVGCASDTPSQFYMLSIDTGNPENKPVLAFNKQLVIGVGPILLPDYLNRPHFVMEVAENEFRVNDDLHWAERLDQNISRVLAQFLADNLGVVQIVRHPWAQKQAIDYQVKLEISAFHRTADGNNRLQAQWQIYHQEQALVSRQFLCLIPSSETAAAMVKAQSLCLGRLGVDIENELRLLAINH